MRRDGIRRRRNEPRPGGGRFAPLLMAILILLNGSAGARAATRQYHPMVRFGNSGITLEHVTATWNFVQGGRKVNLLFKCYLRADTRPCWYPPYSPYSHLRLHLETLPDHRSTGTPASFRLIRGRTLMVTTAALVDPSKTRRIGFVLTQPGKGRRAESPFVFTVPLPPSVSRPTSSRTHGRTHASSGSTKRRRRRRGFSSSSHRSSMSSHRSSPPPSSATARTAPWTGKFKWSTTHPRGTLVFDATYDFCGLKGKCSLFRSYGANVKKVADKVKNGAKKALNYVTSFGKKKKKKKKHKKSGGKKYVKCIVKDSTTKGVKHSDMSSSHLRKLLDSLLSKSHPRLAVWKVKSCKVHWNLAWYAPYCWGSYIYDGKEHQRALYPTGGTIQYKPVTARLEAVLKNPSPATLKSDSGKAFFFLEKKRGGLPLVYVEKGKHASVSFVFRRKNGAKLGRPVAVRYVLFSSTDYWNASVLAKGIAPAACIGDGRYAVEMDLGTPAVTGRLPFYLSPVYIPSNASSGPKPLPDRPDVISLQGFVDSGAFYLAMKASKAEGRDLRSLRLKLAQGKRFDSLPRGVSVFDGIRLFVKDYTGSGRTTPPASADAVLIRCKRKDQLGAAMNSLQLPSGWKIKLASGYEKLNGGLEILGEIKGVFGTACDIYKEHNAARLDKLLRSDTELEIVGLFKTRDGGTVYKLERGWVKTRKMNNGIRIVERGTETMPVGSRQTLASRISYNKGLTKLLGGLSIGMIAISTADGIITARREGDNLRIVVYSVEGTVQIASEIVQLTRWAKTPIARRLGWVAAGIGYLETAYEGWKVWENRHNDWKRREHAQKLLATTVDAGIGLIAAAYPPAAVIDPTFRATVYAMNTWYPAGKSSKRLTSEALSSIGSAFSFMTFYLTSGLTAEIAKEALRQAVSKVRKDYPNHIFVAP